MKLAVFPAEYERALPVIRKIEQAGHNAFFVGGSVRDCLLQQSIHDVDIATSAFPEEIKAIFPRTIDVGIKHGTVLVLTNLGQYEITTFRTESAYQDYRRPDQVKFVRSLEEDLRRRDFTINAFALKQDGEVIDLFGGLNDLKEKKLKAVGDPYARFSEDALRMMRGLRFVSQLGFKLTPETFTAIKENHALLAKISIERINVEFVKLLLGSNRRAGIEMLLATQCYKECPKLSKEKQALKNFSQLPDIQLKNQVQAWTLLIDQLELAESDVRSFLKSWKCSNEMIHSVQILISGLKKRKRGAFGLQQIYHLGKKQAILIEELLPYYDLPTDYEKITILDQQLAIHSLKELAVNGHDLMQFFNQTAGKWLKEILLYLENAVVNQQVANDKRELLRHAAKKLKTNSK
ncbi:MAG TPA: CCA tRNA nucleotidyltransferase [Tetragenococcus sp.]|nr:CCA tRNA nucleotidyltransferase [Tetragenococcus sp.]